MLVPLWRRRHVQAFESTELRKSANIALFHGRNNELEAELAAGNIDREQFDSLVLELQQSLLADVSDAELEDLGNRNKAKARPQTRQRRFGLNFVLPIVLAVLVPIVAYALYERWGFHDDVALTSLFERTMNNRGNAQQAQELIVALGQAVQANEDLPWPWYFLGENFASIGLFNEAQVAYRRAALLLGDTPESALALGRVAMSMYINADLQMSPAIMEVIDRARAINPNETGVLQLLASDAEQRQDWDAAIENWRLLIQQNPNSPQADALRASIAAAQRQLDPGAEATTGPVVELSLSLAPELEVDNKLRVFVAVRNATREGMPPLAVADLTVADLPATIRLDNSDAVGPFDLSSAETVTVSALVSRSGVANPQAGDFRVLSEPLELTEGVNSLDLVLSGVVR